MNGLRWVFVCGLVVFVGNAYLMARAQNPEAAPPKPASQAESSAAEKSVITESAKSAAKAATTTADFCQCVGQGDSASAKRIDQALAGPLHSTGLDYADQPLQDVLAQLSEEYNIPIQLDKTALEEAGIGTDTQVTVNIHNVSLKSALRLMLKRIPLTYLIQDEVLIVTSKEEAEKQLTVCVYDSRKIVPDANEKTTKSLVETITACVDCDTWAQNGGGNAEIRALPSGLLVITQTQAVHQEIRDLLSTLRNMSQARAADPHAAASPAPKDAPK